MKEKQLPVQRLVQREVVITLASITLAALYQTLWYVAPQLLALPLWSESLLTVSFALGTLAILVPIVSAYYIVAHDLPSDEAYEVSHH